MRENSFFLSIFFLQKKSKVAKFASKQISYSNVLQSLLNNPSIRVKIADLGNACFDVSHFERCENLMRYHYACFYAALPFH